MPLRARLNGTPRVPERHYGRACTHYAGACTALRARLRALWGRLHALRVLWGVSAALLTRVGGVPAGTHGMPAEADGVSAGAHGMSR